MNEILLCLFSISLGLSAQAARQIDTDIYLVSFNSHNYDSVRNAFQGQGLKHVYHFGSFIAASINVNVSSVKNKLQQLKTELGSEITIEKNFAFYVEETDSSCITDTYDSPEAWHLNRINQRDRLDFSNNSFQYSFTTHDNGEGIDVYIMDTGIYINHTEFSDNIPEFGFVIEDILDNDGTESDRNGHGTHVSALVSGASYGVAKDAQLISVKCFDMDGNGSLEEILLCLEYIYNDTRYNTETMKAVVNFSFTTKGDSSILEDAIGVLHDNNSLVMVAAAGNFFDGSCGYIPGKYDKVIDVSATSKTDELASFSNWGTCVNILAPGDSIQSADINNETDASVRSGTSFSAALVTGAVARYLSNTVQFRFDAPEDVYGQMVDDATRGKINVGNPSTKDIFLFVSCKESDKDPGNNDLSPGAIAGITILAAAGTTSIVAGIAFVVKSKKATSPV